ncbi:MAG: hypothetical protein IJK97_00805 [Thermoguttaceae bacterium]|nr:hypothetical protein [Thermoguttaceae bacterium]MBR0190448.1 hypothetical protein [Thermoguttaceae bacterium]
MLPKVTKHFAFGYSKIFEQFGETFSITPVGAEKTVDLQGVRTLVSPATAGEPAKRFSGRIFQITFMYQNFMDTVGRLPQERDTLCDSTGTRFQVVSIPGHFRYEYCDPWKIAFNVTVTEC